MSACADLIRFVDGELEAEHAAAFRDHLSNCNACQGGLVAAMQLSTRLASLSPVRKHQESPALHRKPVDKPISGTVPRAPEVSFLNRGGCAGLVVWTLSTLLPAAAIARLRMWPWVHRTRRPSQDST